jgi:hypothetical protein
VLKRLGKRQDATGAYLQDNDKALREAKAVFMQVKDSFDPTATMVRRFYSLGDDQKE